jgi:molybdopterin-dependent oxidoreductase alpha subunit
MKAARAGGGWKSVFYIFGKARQAGGLWRLYRALRAKNACKTCALGMGGQQGGMVNEHGRFPEVCKKSIQAMAADMQGGIREHFFNDFTLDKLRGFTSRELEAAGRITTPLIAGPLDSTYRPLSWDDALDRVAGALKKTPPAESFFYFSGRSSNEAGFLLQLFARLYGTNNVNNCSYYCHQASGVGLASVTGSGTATIVLDDLDGCDLMFLIGANPASNHPRFMRTLVDLRRRGGKIIVINPLREIGLVRFKVPSDVRSLLFGSEIATEYVQPHIGGDIATLTGLAKAVIERGGVDGTFVAEHADDWDEFRAHVGATPWNEIVERSGVDRDTFDRVARLYIESRNTIFAWAMGVTHHEHGVGNVQMIAALAMIRGMLGRPNRGLLPLRGHSNVQGIGSVGAVPTLRPAVASRLQESLGITLPQETGLDTLDCMNASAEGRMTFAWCLGGNLYASNPDLDFAARAMGSIDTVVHLSTTLNTGHVHARGKETIILPVLARDEEPQPTTQESMFNFVRLSDGGRARYEGPRSEVDVVVDVARRVLGDSSPVDWESMRDHERIRAAIADAIPGYDAIGRIGSTREEFQIDGRTFHEPRFKTESGRAVFHVVDMPAMREGGADQLRLMTIRSEGQFNTVVYEEEDVYRGQERRDVIMMSRADIERLGLAIDQPVTVRSAAGALSNVLVRAIDIPPGNCAMYYPEANVIVPKVADDRSKTPAFKNTLVTIEP